MKAFTIDTENNITAFTSGRVIAEHGDGTAIFSSSEELDKLAETWPGARLIEIWNSLPGVVSVRRFTNRKVAAIRIWNCIQHLEPAAGGKLRKMAPKEAPSRAHAGTSTRPPENSKTDRVIALLRMPRGATLSAIMGATGWQAHSVRGFVSGHLRKKMGLKIQSFKRDGERVYALKSKTNRPANHKPGSAPN